MDKKERSRRESESAKQVSKEIKARGRKIHETVQLEDGTWIEPKSAEEQNQLFGKIVQSIRLKMNYSIDTFGQLLGVGKQHVIKWEQGTSGMTNSTKYLLFDVLGHWLKEQGLQWESLPKHWFTFIPRDYRDLRGWKTETQVKGLLDDEPGIYDLRIIPPLIGKGIPIMRTGSTLLTQGLQWYDTPDDEVYQKVNEESGVPEQPRPDKSDVLSYMTKEQLVGKSLAQAAIKQSKQADSLKKALLGSTGENTIEQSKKMTKSRLADALLGNSPTSQSWDNYQTPKVYDDLLKIRDEVLTLKDDLRETNERWKELIAEKDKTIAAKDELIAELRERIKEIKGQASSDSVVSGVVGVPVKSITNKPIDET